jgi:hypothetical protein
MAPLEHLFNDHTLCSTNWYPVKQKQQNFDSKPSIEPTTNVTQQIVPDVVINYCLVDSDEGDERDCALQQEMSTLQSHV